MKSHQASSSGVGYVYKDKRSGRKIWVVAYQDVDGRLRRLRTKAATKGVAERILADRQDAVERARLQDLPSVEELLAPKPAPTLRQFAKEYLHHVEANLTESSSESAERTLRVHLLPKLGSLVMARITPGDVQKFADQKRKDGLAPSTVLRQLMVLSGVFREARKRELVDRNPVSLTDKPKVENTLMRFLEDPEEKRLLPLAPEPLRSAIVTAIHSGLREGEQTRLKWTEVHLGKAPAESYIVVRKTKSHKDRVIWMSDTLYRTLKALPRRFRKDVDGRKHPIPWVFSTPVGDRYDRFNNTVWRRIVREAGIENFRWHDLRHTFGSRLAQAGVPALSIKDLMGHSDLRVTMRYLHLAPSNLKTAVRALDGEKQGSFTTHIATQRPVDGRRGAV